MSDIRKYQELHTIVLRLVDSGNDESLHDWLRNNKLLVKSCKCKSCFTDMAYAQDNKLADKHKWICQQSLCNNNVLNSVSSSVRQASFFENFPKNITLFDAFKLILLWCDGRSINSIDFDTEKQRRTTRQVFLQCDKIAEAQMKKEWPGKTMVGGNQDPNLVLMDMFPNGYMLGNSNEQVTEGDKSDVKNYSTQGHNSFLCLADMSFMPPMVWVHLLRQGDKIAQLVQSIVHPDAIMITNKRIIPADRLRQEAGFRAVDVETLQTLDNPQNNIYNNIGTIWKNVLPVLIEAEHLPMCKTRLLIGRFLWHQRFGPNAAQALYNLLVQVSQQFQLAK